MSPSGRQCDRNATVGSGRERSRLAAPRQRGEEFIKIAEYGEFALIAAIGKALPDSADLIVGVGDDPAVVRAPDGRVFATTDRLIVGRHFRREWRAARENAAKARPRKLRDIARVRP